MDLTTTDPAAAKSFYGGLFGWSGEEMAMGEGPSYLARSSWSHGFCRRLSSAK